MTATFTTKRLVLIMFPKYTVQTMGSNGEGGHWTRWSEDVLCCAPLTRDVSPLLYSFVSQAYVRNTAQVREKLVRLDKF